MYDFHDSTDTLKFWTEKVAINKTFFVFHSILMKPGEVVVIHVYYNFTKFHQNQMKNKKVLLIACFSVQNFKVSVELWILYIVLQSTLKVWREKLIWGFFHLFTMYDFHNSTDTLKFWTEKWAINKTFLFFIRIWWNLVKL